MMMQFRTALIAAIATMGLVSVAASAQEAGQRAAPTPSLSKQIGDWAVQCYTEGPMTTCRMNETLERKNTHMRILSITVLYLPAQKRTLIEAIVPLSVALQNGVSMTAGTFNTGTLQYNICVQQGCQTMLPADDASVKALSSATKGSVQIVDFGTGKKVSIPFPLNGFSEAYQTVVSNSRAPAAAAPAAN